MTWTAILSLACAGICLFASGVVLGLSIARERRLATPEGTGGGGQRLALPYLTSWTPDPRPEVLRREVAALRATIGDLVEMELMGTQPSDREKN